VPLKLEVSSSSRGSLSYRVYECPVRELARMYPAQLCGSFEEGLRDRLLEICAGRLTMVQNKSMGNGDHYCEFEAHET
jgi:hypothetical protein